MTLAELSARWRGDADRLEHWGDSRGAELLRLAAAELDAAVCAADDEELTLEEAVQESGYSERRLRELIADGTIPQAGRKGAPRIRRRDLPRRAKGRAAGYDPDADARALLSGHH